MSSPRKLSAEDIVDWLTPSQAAQLLNDAYGGEEHYAAKRTLLGRLRGGMVQAVSGHSVIGGRSGYRDKYLIIPTDHWQYADEANLLWISGDFEFQSIDEESAYRNNVTTRHYGVKFDPQGIGAIIGAGTDPPPPPEQSRTPEPEQDRKRPPVPPAHLQAWYAFYKAVTKGADDTEDHAWVHAKRCFSNNTVSRESVRMLRGAQKRGPKAGA